MQALFARTTSVLEYVLDVVATSLAPPRCSACDAPTGGLAVFCRACAMTAERADGATGAGLRPLRGDVAAFVYGGAVAEAIVRFKYGGRPDLARPLGDLLGSALTPHAAELRDALVVPVPLHPARLAERGYNQSALLGGRVARRLGIPLRALALARTEDTVQQASLDRAARLVNVAGTFRVRAPHAIEGRPILLIDDVRTTGATLRAAGDALKASNARAVYTAVLAVAAL
jgi:ComF family protein